MAMALFLLMAISVASLISISDAAPAENRINEAGNLAGHTVLKASILARRKRSPFPSNNGLLGIPKPASTGHVEGGAGPDDARAFLLTHTKERVGTNAGAGERGWKTPTSGEQIQASSNIGYGTVGGGIKPAIGVDPPKHRVGAGFAVDRSGAGFEENLPRPGVGVDIDPGFSGGGRGGGFKPHFWRGVDTGFSGGSAGHGAVKGSGAAWIGSPVSVAGGSGGGGGGGGDAGWQVRGSARYEAATGWGAKSIGGGIGGGDGGGRGGGKVHIGGNQFPGGGAAPKQEAAALIGHGGVGIEGGEIDRWQDFPPPEN